MAERILVVGASLAGVRIVQALRRKGSDAEIVLVGDEPGASDGVAADRPPLSEGFLADPATEAPALISGEALAELGVWLVTGRATDLDLEARRVALHGGHLAQTGRVGGAERGRFRSLQVARAPHLSAPDSTRRQVR
jgi:NADPH-dependent 2,4-dienoyl-CoA reductase/sulfur reductase-like enzyme